YHSFIYPYTGSYGAGATANRFFPCLGNHDWGDTYPNPTGAQPYFDYFTLPNNERYYDFVRGSVHFFAIDSDPNEPSGTSSASTQGNWLKNKLAASTAKWKIVYFHHAPYSSGSEHGSSTWMQWPFQQWGATAVLAGHDHDYERVMINGFPYFVNGLGGNSRYSFGTPISGSVKQYNSDAGASVTKPFTFTASGVNGATITATLQLQNGTASLGTVSKSFVLGPNDSLANSSPISIPDSGIGSPYPSKIPVANLPTNPSKV